MPKVEIVRSVVTHSVQVDFDTKGVLLVHQGQSYAVGTLRVTVEGRQVRISVRGSIHPPGTGRSLVENLWWVRTECAEWLQPYIEAAQAESDQIKNQCEISRGERG